MRVIFAGVGEAFDNTLPNTSILVESGSSSILLDCGFTASCAFCEYAESPLELDAIYISHFHADHYFGLPALLVRSIEEGRKKRLTILGPHGIEQRVTRLMEMAYSNALSRAKFEIFFMECQPGDDIKHGGFRFRFDMSNHSQPCLALRLDAGDKSLFYSGDGAATDGTRELAQGCDLVICESYIMGAEAPGHGNVEASLDFARKTQAKACALVHIQRTVRKLQKSKIIAELSGITDFHAFLPEPGDSYEF